MNILRRGSVRSSDGLREGQLDQSGLLGFFASFDDEVAVAEANADLLQEIVGRSSAGEDPNEIVGDLQRVSGDVNDNRFRLEFNGVGLEQDFYFAGAHEFFDPLVVAILDSAELVLPITESDVIAGLVGQTHGGFDSTIAPADDKDFLIDVVISFDQAVHDLRQALAFDAKLARSSGLP